MLTFMITTKKEAKLKKYFWSASMFWGALHPPSDQYGVVEVKNVVNDEKTMLELVDAINEHLQERFPIQYSQSEPRVEVGCLNHFQPLP